MGRPRVYLDTHYLLEMMYDKNPKDARRLLGQIRSRNYDIVISQTVLGEMTAKVLEWHDPADLWSEPMKKFTDLVAYYKIDVKKCLVAPGGIFFTVLSGVRECDVQIDPTDAMILSHAMADRNSRFLFTKDKKMLGSGTIKGYDKELVEEGHRKKSLCIAMSFDKMA